MSLNYTELSSFWNKIKSEVVQSNQVITSNSHITLVSDLEYVDVPTPYGTVTGTHPSVLYFPDSFSGYKYWMAFTPYPQTARENPCILGSNDLVNWSEPDIGVNPIDPTPPTGYNSDTELVFGSNNKLYCYWRWYTDGVNNSILYRMESTNGKDWTNKTECLFTEGYIDPLSPSVLYGGGKWELWVGAGTSQREMIKFESDDGITWTNQQECTSNGVADWGFHWHPMVWRELNAYYCLSSIGSTQEHRQSWLMTDLYFGWSKDGINWTFDSNPVLFRGQFEKNQHRVYRSSAIRVTGNELEIFVSGLGKDSERISKVKAVINPPIFS